MNEKQIKRCLLALLLLLPKYGFTKTLKNDFSLYKSGESRIFSINYKNEILVCLKKIDKLNEQPYKLKEKLS